MKILCYNSQNILATVTEIVTRKVSLVMKKHRKTRSTFLVCQCRKYVIIVVQLNSQKHTHNCLGFRLSFIIGCKKFINLGQKILMKQMYKLFN